MVIKANEDKTLDIIELAGEYMATMVCYSVFTIISVLGFIFFSGSINLILMILISLFGTGFCLYNYKCLQNKQYDLNDCYIRLSETYLEFKQLVNGQYQFAKINIKDITSIMKVKEGFQIWFNTETENSMVMMDEDVLDANTVCINFYAYDVEEYITLYLQFLSYLPEDTERELDSAEWKEEDSKIHTKKMIAPCILYVIPAILSFIL